MDEVREWFSQSEYDLGSAEAMFDSGRYTYAVFMCHLAVEKALKGLVVQRTAKAPPRTHNLVQLVGLAQPDLTPAQINQIPRSAWRSRGFHQIPAGIEQGPRRLSSRCRAKLHC
ncbi:MAG: HEPN domain-containing protein [Bacillota bacterium]